MKKLFTLVFLYFISVITITSCGGGSLDSTVANTDNSSSNNSNTIVNDNNNQTNTDNDGSNNTNQNNSTNDTNTSTNTSSGNTITYGTAQLGNLSNADVEIYEILPNGSLNLLWTEITSAGNSLDEIGKFNTHSNEMNDDSLYLIKVQGGEDWDKDDNGIKDTVPTVNKGMIRLIAKGKDIKKAGNNLRITVISELAYEHIAVDLKYKFDIQNIYNKLNSYAKEVLFKSVDFDYTNNIDIYDLIIFNPVQDKDKLNSPFDIDFSKMCNSILAGGNLSGHLTSISTIAVGSYKPTYEVYYVALSNDETKAFLATREGGLTILDVSDITNPTLISSIDTNTTTTGTSDYLYLTQDESKVFIANGNEGIKVVDVSNPYSPRILSSIDTTKNICYIRSITLSSDENTLYVACGYNKVYIIDVSNIYTPRLLGSVDIQSPSTDFWKVILLENQNIALAVAGQEGLQVIDISNKTNPVIVNSLKTGEWYLDIVLSKDKTKAFVANGYDGFKVIDITNPRNPIVIKSISTNSYVYSLTISSTGNKLYLSEGFYTSIYDISDPNNPQLLDKIYASAGTVWYSHISKDETKAYLASHTYFYIFDLNIFK